MKPFLVGRGIMVSRTVREVRKHERDHHVDRVLTGSGGRHARGHLLCRRRLVSDRPGLPGATAFAVQQLGVTRASVRCG